MTHAPSGPATPLPQTIVVSGDPKHLALLRRAAPEAQVHTTAADGFLAALRSRPQAVVFDIGPLPDRTQDLVVNLRRERPDTRVYLVTESEGEPAARALVNAGAADYFVLPGDLDALAAALAPDRPRPGPSGEPAPREPAPPHRPPDPPATSDTKPATADGAPPASEPARPLARRRPSSGSPAAPPRRPAEGPSQHLVFEASCRLARLAMRDAEAILNEGTTLLCRALGARWAAVHLRRPTSRRVKLVQALEIGGLEMGDLALAEDDRMVEVVHRGQALVIRQTNGPEAGGAARILFPLREEAETFGVLSVSVHSKGSALNDSFVAAAQPLVDTLACLYRAAVHRDRYASSVLRDPETALLAAEPFEECIEKMIDWAWDREAEVVVIVLQAQGSAAASAETLAQFGRALNASLGRGRQGGRLGPARFGVAWPRLLRQDEEYGTATAVYQHVADRLADLGPRVAPELAIRTGMALFPVDSDAANILLQAAQERLSAHGSLATAT